MTSDRFRFVPAVLTSEGERETWLRARWDDAKQLQRPLPDGALQIVARGERQEGESAA